MKRFVFIPLLVVTLTTCGQDMDDTIRAPRWTVRSQFAGMQGLISAGLLWNVPDGRLQIGSLYGYAPGWHGGADYHGVIVRATGSWFPPHEPQFGKWSLGPIASLSAAMEVGSIAFISLPDEYPDGYYGPQALHGLLGLGVRLGHVDRDGGWSCTAEAVTLDTFLWYGIIQNQIEVWKIWNLALGFEYYF